MRKLTSGRNARALEATTDFGKMELSRYFAGSSHVGDMVSTVNSDVRINLPCAQSFPDKAKYSQATYKPKFPLDRFSAPWFESLAYCVHGIDSFSIQIPSAAQP